MTQGYKFGTLAVHAGAEPDVSTGAVIEPISLSTTFAQKSAAKPVGSYEYSRSSNPNRDSFETAVAALEGGKYALAYSSGSATTANVLQSLAIGSHVVSIGDVYGGTHRYFTRVADSHGVETTFTNDISAELAGLIKPETRLIWIESPSNPTLTITDIASVANIVAEVRATRAESQPLYLVVDNTFLSPYVQNPLRLGADLVVHSVTKYINGHSDVVMGVAITNNEVIHEKLRFLQNAIGAVPSAFDSWLAHRGLKTLHLRARAASHNAQAIAEVLESHVGSSVVAVSYPGLKSHPQRSVVQRQHRDGLGGGMISFRIRGGAAAADKFCQETKLFTLAESLGGIESLCEVPAVMTHAGIPREKREESGVYDDLIRLSVGIEETDDLVHDVLQALEKAAVVN
ncbi:cystathionine gamma-lyase CYS3 [Sugiyamaella lignohabitans]|uniref:cystathionine gamma-lyase n=1 Tax=Sugiyamaella lignohabitans TaxID=796027 RepID=A0A167FXE2_9ASCO|nr:cystathionine gamma-lyase CYS3 [Sugiyamaella lignohabitans]ANB15826.1 cystathionine gamma-lyase CYS3 [Sugiyamaella lignohabitans]